MRQNKYPGSSQIDPRIVKAVAGAIGLFIIVRLFIAGPHLIPWMIIFFLIFFILIKVSRRLGAVVFPACPNCGTTMDQYLKYVVFDGAANAGGRNYFPALAMEISTCPECNTRHLRLSYANSVKGDRSDNSWKKGYLSTFYGEEMPVNALPKGCSEGFITAAEYQEKIAQLKAEVINNNRQAGFKDNPKDIRI